MLGARAFATRKERLHANQRTDSLPYPCPESDFDTRVFFVQAGRIEALDKLAKEWVKGADAKEVLEKISEAVKKAKERYGFARTRLLCQFYCAVCRYERAVCALHWVLSEVLTPAAGLATARHHVPACGLVMVLTRNTVCSLVSKLCCSFIPNSSPAFPPFCQSKRPQHRQVLREDHEEDH